MYDSGPPYPYPTRSVKTVSGSDPLVLSTMPARSLSYGAPWKLSVPETVCRWTPSSHTWLTAPVSPSL